jgi:rod shape-determining protein MreC
VPRNRTARPAVLGFPVRRPATTRASLRSSSALRRRLVVGVLALLALALITVSFRESESGPLQSAEEAASTVLRPFQVAVERVARPFRDAYGWTADVFAAKGDADRLRRENQVLKQQVVQSESALRDVVRLRALLNYARGPEFPADYRYLAAEVVGRSPRAFRQEIVVAVGMNDGVRLNAPVVTNDGLVGQVTRVFSSRARVTLITDEQSAVSAIDLRTDATGIVRHGRGAGDTLILDFVSKKEFVKEGDEIVTAGSTTADLGSLYPRGIKVGVVTSVGQTDTDPYKQVQIEPYVDTSSLHSVLVLVPENELVSGP